MTPFVEARSSILGGDPSIWHLLYVGDPSVISRSAALDGGEVAHDGRVQLQFRVLGNIEVLDDARALPLGGPRQRLLVAALLASRRQVVSLDALTGMLWGEDPPRTARSTLQTSVSKLRRLLAPDTGVVLAQRPPGYLLDVSSSAVDADLFVEELNQARALASIDPAGSLPWFDRALGRWAGSAFAGFEQLSWALPEATHLEELRLQAIEERNTARLSLGDAAAVVSELEGLARREPEREGLWCLLMRALHDSGRQAEALRTGNEFRRHLREQFGLDPSASFVALEREILVVDPSSSLATSAPARPGPEQAPSSPVLAASLIGRDDDLAELDDLLHRSRMVTLTGPGGVGKSVMAVEAARRVGAGFHDGVLLAELAPVDGSSSVVTAIAQAVRAERRAERPLVDAVVDVLGTRELLLVLDNCEHVIDAVGEVLEQVLRWCPSVTVLATSREPLGLSGETVRSVAPLAVPADPSAPLEQIAVAPAVEVFVARVTDVVPGFTLAPDNAAAVAELCIQLDGLPLALELAAARMVSMSPNELVDRLNERFVLLATGRGRVDRHRTLRELVQWSFSLLSDAERDLFASISVFAGGFDLDALERVVTGREQGTSVAGVLGSLVDKSLVVAADHGEQFRYTQLETLRQFGADRLAEQPDALRLHRAHLAAYVQRSTQVAMAVDGPDEPAAMQRSALDADNVRAAFSTAVALNDADAALRLVLAVAEPSFRSIRYEVVDWAETASALPAAAEHPLRPDVVAVIGYGAFVRGELQRAVETAETARSLAQQLGTETAGIPDRVLGNALFYLGRRDEAVSAISRMVELHRRSGNAGRLAHALYMRSVAASSTGDPVGGAHFAEEAAAIAVGLNGPTALAQASYAAGLASVHRHPDEALEWLERAATLADSVGNVWMRSFALTEAMWLRARRGEVDRALRGYRSVVQTWFAGGDWANQWLSIRHLAGILSTCGRDEAAALLAGAISSAGADLALPIDPRAAAELDQLQQDLASRLGALSMQRAFKMGESMRDDAIVRLALEAIDSVVGPSVPVSGW